MKYVAICGGLGNQMFQYAYLLMLQSKEYDISTFIPSNNWEHPGDFELEKVFGIRHKPSIWEKLYHLGFPFTSLFHITHKTYYGRNFKIKKEDLAPKKNYKYFYGTWQSEKYIKNKALIRNTFIFNKSNLSKKTIEIANLIETTNTTCSVHIRRGDYLSDKFVEGFGSCCSLDYYIKAIEYITEITNQKLKFVFFSDDIEWVKHNIKITDALYVDHNYGKDSWQDMYLMSLCNHNIIANSTFSWWGAWLNNNNNKIVIAPRRWWNSIENDDVVPESWLRM